MATDNEKGTVIPGGYPPQQGGYPQQPGYPAPPGYPQNGYPSQQKPPLVIMAAPTTASRNQCLDNYNTKPSLVTGVLLICGGVVRIIIEIILTILGNVHHMNHSAWGWSAFYIATGIIGILQRKRLLCLIRAHMTMCVITIMSGIALMIYSAVSASQTSDLPHAYCEPIGAFWVFPIYPETCTRLKVVMAIHSLASVTAFGVMIIAFVAVVYNCKGMIANCKKSRCCSTQCSNTVTACQVTYNNGRTGPGQNGQVQTISPPPQYTEGQNGQYYPDNPPVYSQQVA